MDFSFSLYVISAFLCMFDSYYVKQVTPQKVKCYIYQVWWKLWFLKCKKDRSLMTKWSKLDREMIAGGLREAGNPCLNGY